MQSESSWLGQPLDTHPKSEEQTMPGTFLPIEVASALETLLEELHDTLNGGYVDGRISPSTQPPSTLTPNSS